MLHTFSSKVNPETLLRNAEGEYVLFSDYVKLQHEKQALQTQLCVYQARFGELVDATPGSYERRKTLAQQLFEVYEFGVELETFDGFEYDGQGQFRRAVYLAAQEEGCASEKAWFTIRFAVDSDKPEDVYAITQEGALFGHLPAE